MKSEVRITFCAVANTWVSCHHNRGKCMSSLLDSRMIGQSVASIFDSDTERESIEPASNSRILVHITFYSGH